MDDAKLGPFSAAVARNVRTWRQRRGLSLTDLAARAGMSKGTLSLIETGDANPTLGTLVTLASALSVDVAELLVKERSVVTIVRAGQARPVRGRENIQLVHAMSQENMHIEVHDIVIPLGESVYPAVRGPSSWGHAFVREGKVEVGPEGEVDVLEAGDYAVLPAQYIHAWRAIGDGPARLWAMRTETTL